MQRAELPINCSGGTVSVDWNSVKMGYRPLESEQSNPRPVPADCHRPNTSVDIESRRNAEYILTLATVNEPRHDDRQNCGGCEPRCLVVSGLEMNL